jgi:chemotaxis signal transduction protein
MSSTLPPGAEMEEVFEADTWDIPDLDADVDPPGKVQPAPPPARVPPPLPVQRGMATPGAAPSQGASQAAAAALPPRGTPLATAAAKPAEPAPSSPIVQPPPLPRQRRPSGAEPSAPQAPAVPRVPGEMRPQQVAPSPSKEWSRLNPGSLRRASVENAEPKPAEPKPAEPKPPEPPHAASSARRPAPQATAGAGDPNAAASAAAARSSTSKAPDTERPKGTAVPPPARLASPEPAVPVARAVPPARTLIMPSVQVERAARAPNDAREAVDADPDSTKVVAVPSTPEAKGPSARATSAPATETADAPKPQPAPPVKAMEAPTAPPAPPVKALVGETRSPRRVSPNVEERPSAECPIGQGSTCPSPAQRGRGEPGTNLGHEVPVETRTAAETKVAAAAPAEPGWLAPILEPGISLDDIERHEAAVLFDFDSDLLPGASEQQRRVTEPSGECICTFWLGADCFGLDVQLVNEVLLIDDILPVPWAPPALLGLFNSRGRIVPVVDLATLLGLPSAPEPRGMAQASPAILIKADSLVAAAIVDRPGLVIQVDRGALTPTDGGSDEPWVKGHLRPDERSHPAVTLLDPACLVQRFLDMSRFPDIRACLGSAGYRPARATSTKNSEGGIS